MEGVLWGAVVIGTWVQVVVRGLEVDGVSLLGPVRVVGRFTGVGDGAMLIEDPMIETEAGQMLVGRELTVPTAKLRGVAPA